MMEIPPLVAYLEKQFGPIRSGWIEKWVTSSIQIVEFESGRIRGATVISTLGLSRIALRSGTSGKDIYQELFLMVRAGQLDSSAPAVLGQVAEEHVRSGSAILRGEVLKKEGRLLKRSFTALYVTLPIYLPKEGWSFGGPDGNQIVLSWILPLYPEEESYIASQGWSCFEDLLDRARFDLFDLDRPVLLQNQNLA